MLSTAPRSVLARRVRWLVAATIIYNVIEAVVAITAGAVASFTAVIGFGLDSVIEVASAAAVPGSSPPVTTPPAGPRTDHLADHRGVLLCAGRLHHGRVGMSAARRGRGRPLPGRERARRGQPRRHAEPVLRRAPHRPRTRLGHRSRRLQTSPAALVLGRPHGRPGHRRYRGQRRRRRLARRHLLRHLTQRRAARGRRGLRLRPWLLPTCHECLWHSGSCRSGLLPRVT